MEIGIDSFATAIAPPGSGVDVQPDHLMENLLAQIELADKSGIDVFGVGEHHREEFLDSATAVILAAAAARTKRIRLTSAVTVLSAADPVRVFEEFATLDLLSHGRAEIVAGRGSSIEAYPLFGFDLDEYDELFAEKLELLLKVRAETYVKWSGKYRPALTGQGVFPRPLQNPLPIWVGVGGTPESFVRAGTLGLPLMVAIIGGEPRRFRPLIDLYREAGARAGHAPETLKVGMHALGFIGDTTRAAAEDYFPGYQHTFNKIGKERGWPPVTRAQFDALRGPEGALLIGDADTVAEKVLHMNEVLGGLSRVTFQMTVATLPQAQMLRAIELLVQFSKKNSPQLNHLYDFVEFSSMSASAPINTKSEEYLSALRHSTAHVMAQAVQELFPGTKLTIGPPIDDGFYYDFDSEHRFVPEDLKPIEKRMRQIAEGNHPFIMSTHSSDDARTFWEARGEKYKVEMINDLKQPTVTYCTHGTFVDLCRGGHVESTREIRHFKLLRIAGAYWRGDEKREQLQRIYGTVWPNKDELDAYLVRMEEAKKRDHRELGPRLGLFTILPETIGPGLIFWLQKGATLRHVIEDYLRQLLQKNGYQFVVTPHIANIELWKTSGHWNFYRENIFSPMKIDEQEYLLKPMNCPGHIQIYKHTLHSYRELPIRITEMGTVYRYERSGVMHGLLRVRGFTQDDAHVFCKPDQIAQEVESIIDLTLEVLKTFGFNEYQVSLSTRPEKYVGSVENWDRAEAALAESLKRKNLKHDIDAGGGAFYGPKIDLKIKDSLGRYWQCSTVQVDFNLPERFDVTYRGDDGKEQRAIMVHRALLGSIERFIGILIENYAGAFPVWLAPVQTKILTITQDQDAYALKAADILRARGIRVETDLRNEKIGLKIREGAMEKIPYLAVIGKLEMEAGTLAIRKRNGEDGGKLTPEAFADQIQNETASRLG